MKRSGIALAFVVGVSRRVMDSVNESAEVFGASIVSTSHIEEQMAGRRETRFEIVNAEGVLRVLRDVVVRTSSGEGIVAISNEPGLAGEVLTIQLASEGNAPRAVRVIDSRPTMVAGQVRHRLRLAPIETSASDLTGTPGEPAAIREAE